MKEAVAVVAAAATGHTRMDTHAPSQQAAATVAPATPCSAARQPSGAACPTPSALAARAAIHHQVVRALCSPLALNPKRHLSERVGRPSDPIPLPASIQRPIDTRRAAPPAHDGAPRPAGPPVAPPGRPAGGSGAAAGLLDPAARRQVWGCARPPTRRHRCRCQGSLALLRAAMTARPPNQACDSSVQPCRRNVLPKTATLKVRRMPDCQGGCMILPCGCTRAPWLHPSRIASPA